MQIYNYNPATFEYIGTTAAEACQVVPGNYLIPACATALPVPVLASGEAAIFNDGAWLVVPDHRGQTVYDSATGAPVLMTQLGALPTNLVLIKPTPTAAQLVAELAANKATALAAVAQFHADTVQRLAGSPTQVEKDSWAMKVATAYSVSMNAPVSAEGKAFMLAAGITTPAQQTAWAASVQANAAKFAGLVGLADKLRSQAKADINAAVDQTALDAAITANRLGAQAVIASLQ